MSPDQTFNAKAFDYYPRLNKVRKYFETHYSQGTPDMAGWAERPVYPDTFIVSDPEGQSVMRPDLDEFTRETIGFDPPPWYSITNPYMPTIPLNSTVIWYPMTKIDQCKAFNRLSTIATGLGVIIARGPLGKNPATLTAIAAGVFILKVAADWYCGKI
jgi:hypothetical protein